MKCEHLSEWFILVIKILKFERTFCSPAFICNFKIQFFFPSVVGRFWSHAPIFLTRSIFSINTFSCCWLKKSIKRMLYVTHVTKLISATLEDEMKEWRAIGEPEVEIKVWFEEIMHLVSNFFYPFMQWYGCSRRLY